MYNFLQEHLEAWKEKLSKQKCWIDLVLGIGRVSQGGRQEVEGMENGMQMSNQEVVRKKGKGGRK